MAVATDTLATVLEVDGLGAWSNAFGRAEGILSSFGGKLDATSRRMLTMAAGAAAGAGLIAAGLVKAVQEAGSMEQISIGFTTILKSADAATAKISELQDFAARTPFNFQETANLSRQLLAMGTTADELVPTMKDLGDSVAALGLGQDVLQRIVFNFGQIQTSGMLTMRELRDFAISGIPVFDILRQKLRLSQEQLRRIGDQGISAAVGLKALREGMRERFGGAMEALNRTLLGSITNLQDSMQRLGASVGAVALGPITFVVRAITSFLDLINKAPGPVKSLVGIIGAGLAAGLTGLSLAMARSIFTATLLAGANARLAQSYYGVAAGAQAATIAQGGTAFAGLGGRAMGFLRGPGGIAMLAGGAGMAISANAGGNQGASSFGTMLGGAGFGAMLGAGAGPMGLAIGGILGAIVSGIGILATRQNPKAENQEAKRQTELLEKIADNTTQALRRGTAFSGKDLPGANQVAIAEWLGRELI